MIEQNIKDLIHKQDPHAGMDQLFFTKTRTHLLKIFIKDIFKIII